MLPRGTCKVTEYFCIKIAEITGTRNETERNYFAKEQQLVAYIHYQTALKLVVRQFSVQIRRTI